MFVRMIAVALLSLFFVTEARAKEIDLRATLYYRCQPTASASIKSPGARLIRQRRRCRSLPSIRDHRFTGDSGELRRLCEQSYGRHASGIGQEWCRDPLSQFRDRRSVEPTCGNPTPSPGASPPGFYPPQMHLRLRRLAPHQVAAPTHHRPQWRRHCHRPTNGERCV